LGNDVVVRDAQPGELPEVGALRVAAYRAHGFLPPASVYAGALRDLGADGDGDVLVAVDESQILGTIMLERWRPSSELACQPDEADIRALAVAPAAQGRGVGRILLRAVIDRAAARRVRHLFLSTQPAMAAAQHLYAAAGFTRIPDRDWSPVPGVTLLAYGLLLDTPQPK